MTYIENLRVTMTRKGVQASKMDSQLRYSNCFPAPAKFIFGILVILFFVPPSLMINYHVNRSVESNSPDPFILNCSHSAVINIETAEYRFSDQRRGTVQYSTVQCSTVQYSTVQKRTRSYGPQAGMGGMATNQ